MESFKYLKKGKHPDSYWKKQVPNLKKLFRKDPYKRAYSFAIPAVSAILVSTPSGIFILCKEIIRLRK